MNELANIPEVTHEWGAILPEIILGFTALLLLVLEVAVPAVKRSLPYLAMAVQGVLALYLGWIALSAPVVDSSTLFGGMLAQGPDTNWMRVFFLACGVFVSHLGLSYLKSRPLARIEFFPYPTRRRCLLHAPRPERAFRDALRCAGDAHDRLLHSRCLWAEQ